MKQELLSALFGVITHYTSQKHTNANGNALSGALTMHYASNPKFRRAVNKLLDVASAYIEGEPVIAVEPEVQAEPV